MSVPAPKSFDGGQVAVTDAPVMLGGSLQGLVSAGFNNVGGSSCYIWATNEGDTLPPTYATMSAKGTLLAPGGLYPTRGTVVGTGTPDAVHASQTSPRFWACCATGQSTTVAWSERLSWSEDA